MLPFLRRLLLIASLVIATLSGLPAHAQGRGPLVLAAASLQESLEAAADAWARKGHDRPVLSFAASSALARQVEAGAPADLFLSADEDWMNVLAGKGLIVKGTRASFLSNQLVLIAPATSKTRLTIGPRFPLARALGSGRLAMCDPDVVPAGRYGKAALSKYGVWSGVADQLALADSVRGALALVERGQSPLGIVYLTDARASRQVKLVGTFPAGSHPPISYPVARLKSSTHRQAEGFRRFLISAEGRAIFRRFGFSTR